MTASLPVPPENSSSDTEGPSASAEASVSPPPKPRTPRAPRRPAASAAETSDSAEAPKPAAKPRAPRTTAARAATGSGTTARTPAAKKPTTPRKPAAPRATAASKTAAAKPTSAKPAATKATTAKPAVPKKPAAPRQTAAAKAAAAKAAAEAAAAAEVAEQNGEVGATPGVGIPPLLPDDIVVPPRPPLPVVAASGATAEADEGAAEEVVASADVVVDDKAVDEGAVAEGSSDPAAADAVVEDAVSGVAVADSASAEAPAGEPVADLAPADVAEDSVPSGAAGDEPVEDPTPADVAIEEPVTEVADASEPDEASAPLATESAPEVVIETPLEHDDTTEASADGTPADEHAVSAAPDTTADAAVVPEDPTPADVRVDERDSAAEEPVEPEPFVDPASHEATEVEDAAPADAVVAETPVLDAPSAESASDEDDDLVPATAVADVTVGASTASDDESAVPALALRTISKSFGELRAVDAIDLTVPAGAFYGLVGPNGAGKTTTLSIIAGLLRPDRGTVTINGVDAARRSREAKKLIGVLPDRLRTFDRLTGRQLLSYYGALRGLPAALVESRTADLARAFDLVEALSRPVSDYSAGMTKKVMLAGAMIHSPRLLVLDEPFEAVDPVSSGVILDILGTYVDHGGTVILSSHGMELVERVCSRVAVIVSGQVLAEGTVDEVRGQGTLEERFRELSGGLGDVEGLEWLHTFSA